MRISVVLLAIACAMALPACQQKPATTAAAADSGPQAVVQAIYAAAAPHLEQTPTPVSAIPMTADLAQGVQRASDEADKRNEPFIDGDLAANCQDCSGFSNLVITTPTPPVNGRAVVEARFKVAGDDNVVQWDMVETPQGWRVDNIRSPDGYNLRTSIQMELSEPPESCADERGAQAAAVLVQECTQVSPATHPPCNAQNACQIIQDEISRGCGLLTGAKPAFCGTPAAGGGKGG